MSYETLIPPRTEKAVPPGALGAYESMGWVAQSKKNGTNSVIVVEADRTVHAHTRHGTPHKAWAFTEGSARPFRELPGSGVWVFNAELLHSKVSGGPRDVNYVHDVLVADGKPLWGTKYADRHQILCRAFNTAGGDWTHTHMEVDKHLWLAHVEYRGFRAYYDSLFSGEDEGLVLKDPNGILRQGDSRNAPWMVKCRRTIKNLSF